MKISIRFKLLSSFLSVVALFGVVSVSGLFLEQNNKALNLQLEKMQKKLNVAETLNFYIRSANADAAVYLMHSDAVGKQNYSGKYAGDSSFVDINFKNLTELAEDASDKATVSEFQKNWNAYKTAAKQVFAEHENRESEKAQKEFFGLSLDSSAASLFNYSEELRKQSEALRAKISENSRRNFQTASLISIAAAIAGVLIALALSHKFASSIKKLNQAALELAKGNLRVATDNLKQKDEIGELARSFAVMVKDLKALLASVERASATIDRSSRDLLDNAEENRRASEASAFEIGSLSQDAERQNEVAKDNVRSLERVMGDLNGIAKKIQVVSEESAQGAYLSEQGNGYIQKIQLQMKAISSSSSDSVSVLYSLQNQTKEIEHIADVIAGISKQTNLLALNAAIEAARAAEHGKGFSVVAGEVRKLSEQTSISASNISVLIQSLVAKLNQCAESFYLSARETESGASLAAEAQGTFDELFASSRLISSEIGDVSARVSEIFKSAEAVLEKLNEMSAIASSASDKTEHIASVSEEQLASTDEVAKSSAMLERAAEELSRQIGKFKM